jgi:Tol biopolymer transport system component/streptogramin lyase
MSELKDLLELGVGDFEPPPAGWDRLLRRASRRRTLRRVTAGVVASLVAIAGIGLVLVTFRGAERPQPTATVENGLIAYAVEVESGADIYTIRPDGMGRTKLTDNKRWDQDSSWSPDGTRIAFTTFRPALEGNPPAIYLIDADGTNPQLLVENGFGPSWSSNGQQIAFSRDIDGNADVHVISTDGSGLVRLTDDSARDVSPTWSPDAAQIAFVRDSNGSGFGPLYAMNADGTDVRELLTDPMTGDPRWSPDGDRIVFEAPRGNDPDGPTDIFLINTDGTGLTRLTDDEARDLSPSWSPDGSKIAFSSDRDGVRQIYVMDVDGSHLTRVTVGPDPAFFPAWGPMPDGQPVTPSLQPAERGTAFDVAFGDGAVWALTCDSGCSGDRRNSIGSALRIDSASGEVLTSVSLNNPSKIAVGEGGVWVISFWDNTVTRIDPVTSQVVATIELQLPFSVCENCPGPRQFLPFDVAVGEGAVWVATGRGVVARIDPGTNEVAAMIRVPADSAGELAVGEGSVWVTENVLGLYRVDPATNEIAAEITVNDDWGRRLSVDQVVVGGDAVFAQGVWARRTTSPGDEEFVFADRGAAIARIDPATDESSGYFPVGDQPRLMAFEVDGLWLWEFGGTRLERIDPESGGMTDTVEAPAGGSFIGVGAGAGWVAMLDGTLLRVDLPAR